MTRYSNREYQRELDRLTPPKTGDPSPGCFLVAFLGIVLFNLLWIAAVVATILLVVKLVIL